MREGLVLILLCAALPARADYSPPPLRDLVLASDVIVQGTIVEVRAETFVVRVRRAIVGRVGASIEVRRFLNWTCASRWAPYATGQEVLLFLNAVADGPYRIQSAGGEGEMPIVDGRVVVSGAYGALAPSGANPIGAHEVYGGRLYGFALDVDELRAAIVAARACFEPRMTRDPHRRVELVRQRCDPSARASSELARALFAAIDGPVSPSGW